MYPSIEDTIRPSGLPSQLFVAAFSVVVLFSSVLIAAERDVLPSLPQIELTAGTPASNVYFEPNLGQADDAVNFIGTGEGFKLLLEDGQLLLSQATGTSTVGIRFVGANPNPRITGAADLPGVSHYYLGSDPAGWIEDVPHYGEVTYASVYAGIDVVFHSRRGNPEYDFVVQPGVDPGVIRLEIAGTSVVTKTTDGSLQLESPGADPIVMAAPVIYQGSRNNTIGGTYEFLVDGTIGFEIDDYDRSQPLIIDPELVFSTYLGGAGFEGNSDGEAADETGNYTCVESNSNELPDMNEPSGSRAILNRDPSRTDPDTVCVKHDPTGQIVYATAVGGFGFGTDFARGSEPNHLPGSVHVTGLIRSDDDFPLLNPVQDEPLGPVDGFIFSLGSDGTLEFSSYLGGSVDAGADVFVAEFGHAVYEASDGSLYVGGQTGNEDFLAYRSRTPDVPTGATINRLTPHIAFDATNPDAGTDVWVVKLKPDRSIDFVTLWGGTSEDDLFAIDVSENGEIYAIGTTTSPDYPVTPGAFQEEGVGGPGGGFLTTLDADGTQLSYSTLFGGNGFDGPFNSGHLDASGNFIMSGTTSSTDLPVTDDAYQPFNAGLADAFIAIISPDGNGTADGVYVTYVGGPGDDVQNLGSTIDRFGNIYLAGATQPDFPVTDDAFQTTFAGGPFDHFLAVLNPSLPGEPDPSGRRSAQLFYSTYLGGSDFEIPSGGIGNDDQGNAYLHGWTFSPDFPVSDGISVGQFAANQPALQAGAPADNYVAKFHIWDEVNIDLKPGDQKNSINANSNAVVRFAVLSSSELFAPDEVDPTTIRIAGAEVRSERDNPDCREQDVNRDSIDDLVCKVVASQLNLDPGASTANLVARTFSGDILMGQDVINVRGR